MKRARAERRGFAALGHDFESALVLAAFDASAHEGAARAVERAPPSR